MNWKPELDNLARREAFAREMGGVDKVKRQRDQGRLTVRERIDKLLDQNSFHEIGAISGSAEYDENGKLTLLTPANCMFGRGKVDGRPVVVVGDDFTVRDRRAILDRGDRRSAQDPFAVMRVRAARRTDPHAGAGTDGDQAVAASVRPHGEEALLRRLEP